LEQAFFFFNYLDIKNHDIKIHRQEGKFMTQTPTGVHIWLVLWKATRAVEARALRSIDGTGLCASDFGVLETLLHKGPLPVNVLGRKLLLTTGSITTAVDRLAKRGLVARKDDPEDRRVRLVTLTPKGRQLIKPAFTRHEADLEEVVSVLTRAERATLVALLRKLGKGAEGTDGASALSELEEAS
jgi:MarR family 2-MHQ and catechol resistance regulon transcriptional repressor